MPQTIACYTIFNIEQTNISNRAKQDDSIPDWTRKRNTQSNLDTLIQVISLRTQPENITRPQLIEANNKIAKLGKNIQLESSKLWYFTFEINYANAYNDGKDELGYLYYDCNGVPMIEVDRYYSPSMNFLDTTEEFRNVIFEVLEDEQ